VVGPGRDDLDPVFPQSLGEIGKTGLVADRQQGPPRDRQRRLGTFDVNRDAPRLGLDPQTISWLHADLVLLAIGLTIGLLVALRSTGAPAEVGHAAMTMLLLMLAQGAVGYVQYFTGLPEALVIAHMLGASLLVVATPDTVKVRKIVEIARTLNPRIEVLIRTHSDEEAALLRQEKMGEVFMGEHELAQAMTREVLSRFRQKHEPEALAR